MSELSELLDEINAAYAGVDGVEVPNVSETMSVGAYLAAMDTLTAQTIVKLDEAIVLAIEANQYVDMTGRLQILRGTREQLLDLNNQIHTSLGAFAPSMTLAQAWVDLSDGDPGDPGNPGNLPADDAVVLYGDTPMLLRANDSAVPAGAAFVSGTHAGTRTSPEIAIESSGVWHIGALSGSGTAEAVGIIKASTVGAVKGVIGELISGADNATLGLSFQAWEAYELGATLSAKANRSIEFISSGLAVLQGRKSFVEWNAEHNAFMNDTENEFRAQADSTLASKVPVVGWVLSPVVDAYRKLSYKLQNTNSFDISVSASAQITGGSKGAVVLGSNQDDLIGAGDGAVLAAGGAGEDRFTAGSGIQYLFGDGGIDTLQHAGARFGQTLAHSGGGIVVSGTLGTHTLISVERIEFADRKLAFDFDNGASAANTARLLGAALDKSGITPQLAGITLQLFDAGFSMLQVAQIGLARPEVVAHFGSLTNAAFVDTVFLNVMGRTPTTAEHDQFEGMLSSSGGGLSQAELLVLAANTAANAVNIDLVGLQQGGLEFV